MLQLDWIAFIVALLIAFIIGFLASRLWTKSRGEDTDSLKRQLDDLKRQHQNYQISVTEHFNRTTQLIDSLNRNYDAIRDHLSRGADELVAPEYRLESARAAGEDLESLAPTKGDSDEFNMPRDYAPKSGHEEGTLSESYGLRRKQEMEDEEPEAEKEEPEALSKKSR